jgi:hypothetical protein
MLSTIILKLLEKHPDNRYQTVDGLIADLRRCQATLTCEGEIVAFTPASRTAPRRSIWRTPCSRRIRRRTTSLPRLSGWGRTGAGAGDDRRAVGDRQILDHRDGAKTLQQRGAAGGGQSRSVFTVCPTAY